MLDISLTEIHPFKSKCKSAVNHMMVCFLWLVGTDLQSEIQSPSKH